MSEDYKIQDSGERTEYESGAVRDLKEGKGRMDLVPWNVVIRLSKHYEKGAKKYEERNWEKGIPSHSFLDSAFRHLAKYAEGYDDEDHLISAIWNLFGIAWNEEKRPDLMDVPASRACKVEMLSEEFERYDDYARGYNDAIRMIKSRGKWMKCKREADE